jgi:hypothetical protein
MRAWAGRVNGPVACGTAREDELELKFFGACRHAGVGWRVPESGSDWPGLFMLPPPSTQIPATAASAKSDPLKKKKVAAGLEAVGLWEFKV